MNLSVQQSQVTDITAKSVLAKRMAGHNAVPEQALKSIFKGAMQCLEEMANKEFDSSLKEKVWNKVSKEHLKSLKEYFLLEFCDRILGTFNANEAEKMLEEHKRTGVIKHIIYSSQIQSAYYFNKSALIDLVVKKANSMTNGWIPEIVKAVREEGVEFPDPEKK